MEIVAVCESTANLWLKTYQAFEKYNIGVKLANPLKTKAIAKAKIKTDTLDARTLAHLLRSDLRFRGLLTLEHLLTFLDLIL